MTAELDEKITMEIDMTVLRLSKTKFRENPLVSREESFKTSFNSSAEKRHGKIIEKCIARALEISGKYEVWDEPRFWISPPAYTLAGTETTDHAILTQLPYRSPPNDESEWASCQIDLLAYNIEGGKLTAMEIKRGNSYNDAPKQKTIVRELRAVQMLLRGYGESKGFNVSKAEAKCLFFYGRGKLPKASHNILAINGTGLDTYFNVPIYDFVERHTKYYQSELLAINRERPAPRSAPSSAAR